MNWLLGLFGYTPPATPERPACVRCGGRSGHAPIDGDGAGICLPCLYRNGRAAADPSSLTAGEALMLAEAHGDCVTLVQVVLPVGVTHVWRWTPDWPVGDAA